MQIKKLWLKSKLLKEAAELSQVLQSLRPVYAGCTVEGFQVLDGS